MKITKRFIDFYEPTGLLYNYKSFFSEERRREMAKKATGNSWAKGKIYIPDSTVRKKISKAVTEWWIRRKSIE